MSLFDALDYASFQPNRRDPLAEMRLELERRQKALEQELNSLQIPPEVYFAAQLLHRHQDTTMPHVCGSVRNPQIIRRDVGCDELMAIGAACDLLADYFDRHNSKRPAGTRPAAETTG